MQAWLETRPSSTSKNVATRHVYGRNVGSGTYLHVMDNLPALACARSCLYLVRRVLVTTWRSAHLTSDLWLQQQKARRGCLSTRGHLGCVCMPSGRSEAGPRRETSDHIASSCRNNCSLATISDAEIVCQQEFAWDIGSGVRPE